MQSIFDWKVILTGPGGVEPTFVNIKTNESTSDPPSGYKAKEIAQLPSARKFIGSVEEIQKLIDMAPQTSDSENGGNRERAPEMRSMRTYRR